MALTWEIDEKADFHETKIRALIPTADFEYMEFISAKMPGAVMTDKERKIIRDHIDAAMKEISELWEKLGYGK